MNKKPPLPSDRSFGLTFAAIFAIVAAWLLYRGSSNWWPWISLSISFGAGALLFSRLLHPLNVAWMWFGGLLNRIVSPIVLGIIFFGMFMPVALLFRLRGRDVLNRKFDSSKPSYWLHRTPPGPDAERSFPRQF